MHACRQLGITIVICFLQTAIVAVFTCCGDPADQGSAYKVHKRVCAEGWRAVDTSSPGSLTEGSPFLTQTWGQQTLCLKVHHTAATWRDARDSCRRQHGDLIDLDFPGFMAPNMVGIIQNLAREVWGEGLRRLWTGLFVESGKLWWENKSPRPVYGNEPGHWWEWLEGQPGQRTGNYGRLDLKNGTNTLSPSNAWIPNLESDQPFFLTHPSSVFRLGLTLVKENTLLPYACINNGFVLPPAQASKCPDGWFGSPYVDKCLWFSYHQAVSHSDAITLCKDKGGQLAMPQDRFYNAYVTKVILNAEIGVLKADDPEVEEEPGTIGSRMRCVFCTNAQSVEKCQPAPEQQNGTCSPDKVCGVKVIKHMNGSLFYTGGCFQPVECQILGSLSLKHLCTTDATAYTLCCSTPQCLQRLLAVVAQFTCEPRFPLVPEGRAGAAGDQPEVECFTCDGVSSDEECMAKGTVVTCSAQYPTMRAPVCQTRVWQESRHSRVKIVKQCVSAVQCESAQQDCTSIAVAPTCVYCCQGHRCNQWLPDNPILRSPLARRAWIGFEKREADLLWVDGRVSTVARWNTTFGSMYPYLPTSGCGQLWADRPWGTEWLVGECATSLPFVCEATPTATDESVEIITHPRDLTIGLQTLKNLDYFSDYDDSSLDDHSLTCGATNYHPNYPVVWVKDGRYHDNGVPQNGFTLDVTAETLATSGDSLLNLQGDYHCEVWDKQGQRRTRSRSATVRFQDVATYQVSLRVPNHAYNSSVHSQATLLFNPIFRAGLEHYRRMVYLLTQLNVTTGEFLPHQVTINAFSPGRSGSLVIDFTLFYELPSVDPATLLKLLKVSYSSANTSPSGLRDMFDERFRRVVVENIKHRVTSKTSTWSVAYGAWGITSSDVTVAETASCPATETTWRGRRMKWPRTPIGGVGHTEQICVRVNDGRPIGTRRCMGTFYRGARWEEASYHDNCEEEESAITPRLRSLSEEDVNNSNTDDILTDASVLLRRNRKHALADVVYTTQILNGVASLPQISTKSASKAIALASILMRLNKTLLEDAQKVADSCNRISTSVEHIGRSVNLQDKQSATFTERNVIVSLHDVINESDVIHGVGYHGNLTNFTEKYFTSYGPSGQLRNQQEANIGVTLPQQLRDMILSLKDENTTQAAYSGKVRVTFTLFQDTDLFISPNTDSTKSNTSHVTAPLPRSLHGAVAVDVRGLKVTQLTQPVLTTFTFQKAIKREDVRCVFWDYSAANGSGDWSGSGCHVNKTSQGRVTCACNHLTTFSVLIASPDRTNSSPRVREVAMTITLLIGLTVSLAGLALSILSFVLFRSFRKTRSQQILFNMAAAALFSNIVFWVGLETVVAQEYCIAMAALLHYFLLAAFTWMLVEAILQYLHVVRMPELPARCFTLRAAVAAWGFPVIVVGVICAVDHLLYASPDHFCWLTGLPLYIGFFLPVAVIFAVVLGISGDVTRRLVTGESSLKCTEVTTAISVGHVLSNVVCFLALVATWVMAYFALNTTNAIFEVLFSVSDACFGVYIFLLLHFREPSSRETWRRLCCKSRGPTKRDSDSSTMSSVDTISSKIVPPAHALQKSAMHAEGNIYVSCPSEKRDTVVKV